jgi:hypothetical protein
LTDCHEDKVKAHRRRSERNAKVDVERGFDALLQGSKLVEIAIRAYIDAPSSYTMEALNALLRVRRLLDDAGVPRMQTEAATERGEYARIGPLPDAVRHRPARPTRYPATEVKRPSDPPVLERKNGKFVVSAIGMPAIEFYDQAAAKKWFDLIAAHRARGG